MCFVCLVLLKPQSGLYAMFSSNTVANVVYTCAGNCGVVDTGGECAAASGGGLEETTGKDSSCR